MSEKITINNRTCTRIPKGIKLEFKKLEYPLSEEPTQQATTRDIAERGVCFTAAEPFETGDLLTINMTLNGWNRHRKGLTAILNDELTKTDVLTTIGEVAWSRESVGGGSYDIGVKFINIYEDDIAALEEYFDKILPDT